MQQLETSPSIFQFHGHTVRILGTPDNPQWVAKDVCEVLGLSNHRKAVSDFEDYEKGVTTSYTPGGEQELLTVTEPGLYRLIFQSRKPEAKSFRRWVCQVVLPAIRKTGSYQLPAIPEPDPNSETVKHIRTLAAEQGLGLYPLYTPGTRLHDAKSALKKSVAWVLHLRAILPQNSLVTVFDELENQIMIAQYHLESLTEED